MAERWRLRGYDAFEHEWYEIGGGTEAGTGEEINRLAQARLRELERAQPSRTSGGQAGIQDQVWIVRSDGTAYKVPPDGD